MTASKNIGADDPGPAVASAQGESRRLAATGAAAKGSMLLSLCGIGTDLLDFAVDRSTLKPGRVVPGAHRAAYWVAGRVIVPVPAPRVV